MILRFQPPSHCFFYWRNSLGVFAHCCIWKRLRELIYGFLAVENSLFSRDFFGGSSFWLGANLFSFDCAASKTRLLRIDCTTVIDLVENLQFTLFGGELLVHILFI